MIFFKSGQNWFNHQLKYCIITDIVAVSRLKSMVVTSASFPGGALPYETVGDALCRNVRCKSNFVFSFKGVQGKTPPDLAVKVYFRVAMGEMIRKRCPFSCCKRYTLRRSSHTLIHFL